MKFEMNSNLYKNNEENFVIIILLITFAKVLGFRSSVGLEQRPSKAWVLGSNPNGITD